MFMGCCRKDWLLRTQASQYAMPVFLGIGFSTSVATLKPTSPQVNEAEFESSDRNRSLIGCGRQLFLTAWKRSQARDQAATRGHDGGEEFPDEGSHQQQSLLF